MECHPGISITNSFCYINRTQLFSKFNSPFTTKSSSVTFRDRSNIIIMLPENEI